MTLVSVSSFLLECVFIIAAVAGAASLVVGLVFGASSRALARLPATLRADAVLVLAILPAVVALAATASAATPSVLHALGLREDHCGLHGHHAHLCMVHFGGMRAWLAGIGSGAAVLFLGRSALIAASRWRTWRRTIALERLGHQAHDGVLLLPGAPRFCHAVGVLRRRVLVSATLAAQLAPTELEAVLAHERAHLARADPLWRLVMRLAGLLGVPRVARRLECAYVAAADEACDARAAHELGDGLVVARALVAVARLQQSAPELDGAAALIGDGIEHRVHALLDAPEGYAARMWALPLVGLMAATAALFTVVFASAIHHEVETLLHYLA